jgi:hypothetical protein
VSFKLFHSCHYFDFSSVKTVAHKEVPYSNLISHQMLDSALSCLFLSPYIADYATDCILVPCSFHTYVLYVDGIIGEMSSVTTEQAGNAVMLETCI